MQVEIIDSSSRAGTHDIFVDENVTNRPQNCHRVTNNPTASATDEYGYLEVKSDDNNCFHVISNTSNMANLEKIDGENPNEYQVKFCYDQVLLTVKSIL